MYSILGWINVVLVALLLLPFALLYLPGKNKKVFKISKSLKKLHRYFGGTLLVAVIAHGILALSTLSLHTGLIAGIMVALLIAVGYIFYGLKKVWAFKLHRLLAVIFILLLLIHLIFPWLI